MKRALLLLFFASCTKSTTFTDAQKNELRDLIEKGREQHTAYYRDRAAALRDAKPRAITDEACDVDVMKLLPGTQRVVVSDYVDIPLAAFLYEEEPGLSPFFVRRRREVLERIDEPLPEALSAETVLANAKRDFLFKPARVRLVLAPDDFKEPKVTGKTFVPGSLRGRLYVYDTKAKSMLCASEVEAGNSEAFVAQFSAFTEGDLKDDVVLNALRAGGPTMRRLAR
ncbi:MAG: hypothetical protein ACO1OB_25285 [Archangium sp.]